jgi:hypothetical protein
MSGLLSFMEHLKQASQRMRTLANAATDSNVKWRYAAVADSLDKMVERAEADAAALGLRTDMKLSCN